MAGDYSPYVDRYGNVVREDPSRNNGVSYGSLGPWAGAVMQGFGMMPTGPLSLAGTTLGLAVQGLTGNTIAGHLGGLLGNGMSPTQRTGLTPEEMMAGRAGGMSGGGWSGAPSVNGLDRGALG